MKAAMDEKAEMGKSDWKPAWKRAAVTKILARPECIEPVAAFLTATAIGARTRPTPPPSPTPSQEEVAEEAAEEVEPAAAAAWNFPPIDEEEVGRWVREYWEHGEILTV